jgi:uncharacterized protein YneF (UPF0154 family)|tara:strand:+ start:281 stop:784 length:504 start_codon:yes stop_codon:yes gene_type:complete
MKIIDKLSTYAALIGVVSAIGGGFYAWGEFNTRLSAIENEPPINLTPLKNGLKEVTNNLSEAKIDLIDRIKNVEDKIQTTDLTNVYARISEVETKIKPTDLTNVYAEIAKVREELAALDIPETVNLKPLVKALQELEKAVAIVQKENQVQDAMIEEIKLKANNPLAN